MTETKTIKVDEEIKPTAASRKIERQEPSFTPGPWRLSRNNAHWINGTPVDSRVVSGDAQIAEVHGWGHPDIAGANARLIAAAPALYQALQALLPYLTDRAQMLDYASLNEGRASGFDVASVKAREALALVDDTAAENGGLQ